MADTTNSQGNQGAPVAPVSTQAGNPASRVPNAPGGLSQGALAALLADVSTNPALVEFPQDPWGFTRELRKAGLAAATRVAGQDDKNAVLYGTLAVLMKHVQNRLKADKTARTEALSEVQASIDEAEKYARQYSRPVNPEDAVRDAMRVVEQARASGQYKDIVGE